MAFTSDSLLDRMNLKHQVFKWRSVAILFAVVLGISVVGKSDKVNTLKSDYIARVRIEDFISSSPHRTKVLHELKEDKAVKAVVVHVNSPGGTIVGGEELYNSIKAISDDKPVVIVMDTIATSGGYMAAMGGDKIFARNGTLTGSIGVLLQSADVTGLAEKVGVSFINFKSGDLKASPSPFEKLTPRVSEVVQSSIMDAYEYFIDVVSEGRPMLSRDEIIKLADGRVYTGRQALKAKLVDSIGDENDAVKWLQKEQKIDTKITLKDVKIIETKDPLEDLLGSYLPNFFPLSKNTNETGILALWQPSLIN